MNSINHSSHLNPAVVANAQPFDASPPKAEAEITIGHPHPEFSEKAMPGLVGDFAKLATLHSEADKAAITGTLLTTFGAIVGSEVHVKIGDVRHCARLFVVIVGQSSRARKGTSLAPIQRLLTSAQSRGVTPVRMTPGPLSSGEGVIFAVRDASEEKDKDGEIKDTGVNDKRLLVTEGEMGAPLAAIQRPGNTLSPIIRTLWDNGTSAPLTKRDSIKTTAAHVCIVGHITKHELHSLLQNSDIWNGFANRFLWISSRRQRMLALPEPMPEDELQPIADAFSKAVRKAGQLQEIKFSSDARLQWEALYPGLTIDKSGIFGVVTSRAEAQVIRLALIYALLDCSEMIGPSHLEAAVAFWQYCDDSARYVFGDSATDPDTNKVLRVLAEGPKSATELNDLFCGHLSGERLRALLADLEASGRVTQRKSGGGGRGKGRPKTTFELTTGFTLPVHALEELEDLEE